jgi:signal transduction histidine kinase
VGDEGDAERVQQQLLRLAAVEGRYREMLLGNPTHPQGVALRELVQDGDFGVAWIAEPSDESVLQIRSNAGAHTDALDHLAIRPGEGLTGKVFRSGEIDWVDAYFDSSSITHDFDGQIRQERVQRLIAVPLVDNGTVVGVLAAGSRSSGLFGGIAVDHIVSTAGAVALRAVIDERQRRMAERVAAEERRRIAMDLHDSVGAMLYSIGADARSMRSALDPSTPSDPSVQERLDRITANTAEASVLLRQALRALHSTPGELAVAAALEADCRAFEQRSGVAVHVVVMSDPPSLPDATVAFVLRALREALLNVEKHARAKSVAVTVSTQEQGFTLTVTDDGTGMPPGAESVGLGLAGLSDSADRLGGRLEVRTGDDGGTVWRLRLRL